MHFLKWTAIGLTLVVLSLFSYCIVVTVEPYSEVAAKLRAAPAISDPPLAAQAALAAEDPRFLQSSRVATLQRLAQIFFHEPGQPFKGASISTQLVRNVLGSRRTLIGEVGTALAIDALWSKERVLSAYLREVHLGQSSNDPAIGFEAASLRYFRKPLRSLSVADMALLAGLIKGPSYYSPFKRPDRALERRASVLESLKQSGVITEQQFNEANRAPLPTEA
jgi:penicillin-binding protein 1B